ncbi:Lrp/AsnC family transcriptional regulator [Streptomyces sp. SudanB182_2057]|uniref:Lrp/AsnC family transcriptional regulator n=1 Tax=Streptomyces sp. SudanB182_2057 TaxID=3035281 RepID=UPI003F57DA5B
MGLSRFEQKLVVALQRDPRAPYATLADALDVDERSVRRAMRRLRDDGVLTYSAAIAREDTHGWLAAQLEVGCRAGTVDKVAHALADRSDTRYVAAATGDADLVVELVARDPGTLHTLVVHELPTLDGVRWVHTQVAVRLLLSAADWAPDGWRSPRRQRVIDGRREAVAVKLDDSDLAIMRVLDEDVRTSAARIAQRVGLHETTVQRRLRKLSESGAVYMRADVPPALLGFPIEARFTLQVRPDSLEAAVRRLACEPMLRALYILTGPSNVLGYSVHRSTGALEDFLAGPLAEIDGLLGCDIRVVLHAYKRNGALIPTTDKWVVPE